MSIELPARHESEQQIGLINRRLIKLSERALRLYPSGTVFLWETPAHLQDYDITTSHSFANFLQHFVLTRFTMTGIRFYILDETGQPINPQDMRNNQRDVHLRLSSWANLPGSTEELEKTSASSLMIANSSFDWVTNRDMFEELSDYATGLSNFFGFRNGGAPIGVQRGRDNPRDLFIK